MEKYLLHAEQLKQLVEKVIGTLSSNTSTNAAMTEPLARSIAVMHVIVSTRALAGALGSQV